MHVQWGMQTACQCAKMKRACRPERSASGAKKACPGASDAARRSILPTRLTCGPASRRRPSLPPLLRGAATTCVQITARMHGHVLASD